MSHNIKSKIRYFFIAEKPLKEKLPPFIFFVSMISGFLVAVLLWNFTEQKVIATAGIYYVDGASLGGTCNNNNPGTISLPWCSISYAVSQESPVQPGNTIYIRAGDYNESVIIGKSGTAEQKITLKNYNEESVVIDGSGAVSSYVLHGGNTYYANSPVASPKGLFIDGEQKEEVWPFPSESMVGNLNSYLEEGQWAYNSANGRIYVKISNPEGHNITVAKESAGINSNNNKWWVIEGLTVKRFADYGIRTNGTSSCEQDYFTIKNNTIEQVDYAGIFIGWCPGVTVDGNIVRNEGLVREKGAYRHQGVKQGEGWQVYSGSVFRSLKGTDCGYLSYGYCNGGPEILYFDGNQVNYNYNEDPGMLSENEWTTTGDNGDGYIYINAPNGVNPAQHRVKRAVFRDDDKGHGIIINTPSGRAGQFTLKNNQLLDNNGKGISICYSDNYCGNSVNGSVVYGNYIYNSGESGFDNAYANGVTISYNILWKNGIRDLEDGEDWGGDKGFQIGGGRTGWKVHHNIIQGSGNTEISMGSGNAKIYHNTVVKDSNPVDLVNFSNYGGYASFIKPGANSDLKVKNNIFVVTGDGNHNNGESGLYGIISCDPDGGNCADNIDWNGNNYYTEETNKRKTTRIGSNDYCLTADQQGENCSGNNLENELPGENRTNGQFDSLAQNPYFKNLSANDLNLQDSSPLVDKAVPLTLTSGSSTSKTVNLADAGYFHDIDDYPDLPENEQIRINGQLCTIIGVNYTAITCNETIQYGNNDYVYWEYNGQKPEIGALEIVPPSDPVLYSVSHPQENSWYSNGIVEMGLSSGQGSDHYHYNFDQNPLCSISQLATATEDQDGIFTVGLQNNGTWNVHVVAHNINELPSDNCDTYQVHYDNTPPIGGSLIFSGISQNTISVQISNASDEYSGLNETERYYFDNITNGSSSGWQIESLWQNNGLNEGTAYQYKVKVKDNADNIMELNAVQDTADINALQNGNINQNANSNTGNNGDNNINTNNTVNGNVNNGLPVTNNNAPQNNNNANSPRNQNNLNSSENNSVMVNGNANIGNNNGSGNNQDNGRNVNNVISGDNSENSSGVNGGSINNNKKNTDKDNGAYNAGDEKKLRTYAIKLSLVLFIVGIFLAVMLLAIKRKNKELLKKQKNSADD